MTNGKKRYDSWGRYPKAQPKQVVPISWRDRLPALQKLNGTLLPFGYGRSYGDSCLNEGGTLLDVTGLNHFIAFDADNGILRCEAGISLAEILDVIVPRGWFLPVSPGTKFVSVGGAIANDVHGKNHHVAGTFGRYVNCFELLRSDGERRVCSPTENSELYQATIGGLGLTGVILWAEFRLKKIATPLIKMESIRFGTLDEFFRISADSDSRRIDYTVAWIDCSAQGKDLGRGRFTRGDFYDPPLGMNGEPTQIPTIPMPPLDFPSYTINPWSVKAFNLLYYHIHVPRVRSGIVHYNPFFYPLDSITDWYRGFGKAGFLQYQFVIPYKESYEPLREIVKRIVRSGQGSFLNVLKTFGNIASPGMLSFPREGVTLALDFANRGLSTLRLLDELDQIVFENNGAIYPAKDARMSPASFRASFPKWQQFAQYIDPKFSSSFWRRVTDE